MLFKNKYAATLLYFALIALFSTSCKHLEFEGYTNEIDTRNPDYIAPIPVLDYMETINGSATLYFSWYNQNAEANYDDYGYYNYYGMYSYMLAGYDTAFCDWVQTNDAKYEYLDDGKYTFYVKGRTAPEAKEEIDSVTVIVQALESKTIFFKPYSQKVDAQEETSSEIWIKDIENLRGISFILEIPTGIEVTKVESFNEIMSQGATDMLFLTNSIDEINTEHELLLDIALLGSDNIGFTGTAPIFKLYYKVYSDNYFGYEWGDGGFSLKDINNEYIDIQEFRGTYIEINDKSGTD